MYLAAAPRRRRARRLGQVVEAVDVLSSGTNLLNSWAGGGCAWTYFYFNRSAWDACTKAQTDAQLQTVPDNAAAAGYPPNVVAVAQAMANQQKLLTAGDVANVSNFYGAGQILYTPQTQSSLPTWAWIAIAAGVGLVAVKVL